MIASVQVCPAVAVGIPQEARSVRRNFAAASRDILKSDALTHLQVKVAKNKAVG